MSAHPQPCHTPEEYLERERKADYRSEYVNGEIRAMAGASREHNLVVTNLVREFSTRLAGRPCETYSNDMRVKVSAVGNYLYPDVVVACTDIQFEDRNFDTLLNPLVIVEVLSPSTEQKDRGEKFLQYQWIESLNDYIFVSPDRINVERFTRQNDGNWLYSRMDDLRQVLALPSVGCELPLAEIYARVTFAADSRMPDRPI
jgi:Uma2 family endonuclease